MCRAVARRSVNTMHATRRSPERQAIIGARDSARRDSVAAFHRTPVWRLRSVDRARCSSRLGPQDRLALLSSRRCRASRWLRRPCVVGAWSAFAGPDLAIAGSRRTDPTASGHAASACDGRRIGTSMRSTLTAALRPIADRERSAHCERVACARLEPSPRPVTSRRSLCLASSSSALPACERSPRDRPGTARFAARRAARATLQASVAASSAVCDVLPTSPARSSRDASATP